jgi:hypothetical protein
MYNLQGIPSLTVDKISFLTISVKNIQYKNGFLLVQDDQSIYAYNLKDDILKNKTSASRL